MMTARVIAALVVLMALGFFVTAVLWWFFDDVSRLMNQINDPDPNTRAFAAQQLGRMGAHRAYSSLVRLLVDEDPRVRITAAEALADIGDPRALRAVARTYKRDVGGRYDRRYEKAIAALLEARKRERAKKQPGF
jgi:HEAT repeat protein